MGSSAEDRKTIFSYSPKLWESNANNLLLTKPTVLYIGSFKKISIKYYFCASALFYDYLLKLSITAML